jgi:hypothetical protein
MEVDKNPTEGQSVQIKRQFNLRHMHILMMLGGIVIFYLLNKLFLAHYLSHSSLTHEDYGPQINPVLVLMEVIFLIFIFWLFKRRFQFGLRALLIFVTIFACACSWFTVKTRQARIQRETLVHRRS